jgi:peptidoglycan-associated lipoprotein
MITICRKMTIVLIGIWLGGCSVVVFEDSRACPSQTACPVDSVGEAPASEGASPSELVQGSTAPNITPSDETSSSLSQQPGIVSEAAPLASTETPSVIDGYLSYFDYDSASLRAPNIAGLLFVSEYLKTNPATRILVEGHCDERGTRDYNLALGEKRAEAVRTQLANLGIDRRRIKTRSFGKERPAMLGTSPEAWAKNRRAVIRLIAD